MVNLIKIIGHITLGLVAVVIIPLVVMKIVVSPSVPYLVGHDEGVLGHVLDFFLIGLTVTMYFAYVKLYEKRRVLELVFPGRGIAFAVIAGCAMLSSTIILLFIMGYYQVAQFNGFDEMVFVLFGIAVVAIVEEFVLRGILFRICEAHLGTLYALLSVSTLFAVGNILIGGMEFTAGVAAFLISAVWCGIYILSRNIWVVGFHHAAWNYTEFSIGILDEHWRVSAPIVTSYQGPVFLTGGSLGPEGSIITAVVCMSALVFIYREVRNRPFTRAKSASKQIIMNLSDDKFRPSRSLSNS